MNALKDFDTDQLLQSAALGNGQASDELLNRHRRRLKQLVSIRLNPALAARVDASDVVQDVLTIAHQQLEDFAREKPIAFYPWLRQITLSRMLDLYRHHVLAAKRSTSQEQPIDFALNDHSANLIARQFVDAQSSPSKHMMRSELKRRVTDALEQLSGEDREIVVMRHLEELSVKEIAAILGLPEGTVMSRHFRAVRKLRRMLDD